ncbi:coiled-coil domain-containing protein 71-like [Carcharodon carcharias]|uniref:coiled-coil domain-containing protein 71-like n=1 Tax=Carcharodon carcharias TaxID=13397 RepID=UPI001B7E6ED6|nr:coiled-coil domain-containing protein 71-like [Carcharodon carcharias]
MAQPPEGPAVQAWSRIPVVGPRALEDALTVFSPLSPDPLQRQSQLLSFVEGLREEGYLPTVLRSRDVYGYTSCTCQVPGAGGPAAANTANTDPPPPTPPPRPPPPPPPPLSSSSSSWSSSSGSSARAGGGNKTPRKSPKWNGWLRPPASGVRLGQEKGDSGQRRHRYPERRGPAQRESRRPRPRPRPSQSPPPPPPPPPPEGELSGRGRPPDLGEAAGPLSRSRLQLLRSKVIKVDDSSSDEEVRRKAQKILRVNLSPVIKIRPISYPHH